MKKVDKSGRSIDTRRTGVTSAIGSTTPMTQMTPFARSTAPSQFMTVEKSPQGGEILDYPYAYDQDREDECEF